MPSSKAAGWAVTEAYIWSTPQGNARPRTPLEDIFSVRHTLIGMTTHVKP